MFSDFFPPSYTPARPEEEKHQPPIRHFWLRSLLVGFFLKACARGNPWVRNLASEQEGTNWEGTKLMILGCGGAARRRRKILGCICVLTHTFPLFLNDLGASCGAVSWLISLSKLYSAYNLSLKQQKTKNSYITKKSSKVSYITKSQRDPPTPGVGGG